MNSNRECGTCTLKSPFKGDDVDSFIDWRLREAKQYACDIHRKCDPSPPSHESGREDAGEGSGRGCEFCQTAAFHRLLGPVPGWTPNPWLRVHRMLFTDHPCMEHARIVVRSLRVLEARMQRPKPLEVMRSTSKSRRKLSFNRWVCTQYRSKKRKYRK